MGDSEPRNTEETSRSAAIASEREPVAFLVKALECEEPGADAVRHVLRKGEEIRIGRGDPAYARTKGTGGPLLTIRVPDRKMSGEHARISREGSSWILEDLGSTNGTVVGGERITRTELMDGQVIELGSTVFLFREIIGRRPQLDTAVRPTETGPLDTLNPELEEAMERVRRVAVSPLAVLVLGETGTGKEGIARAVHELSKRPGPLVAVNAGAIPGPLLEAQLFGHMKGSFTGAMSSEVGFVRSAHFGTLFLDEIADLPSGSQAALLRVLQNGEVTPVGSTRTVRVDVRIIAATHQNLPELTERGIFRRDLYARLAGFLHTLPPLADRREDLGWLIGALLSRHGEGARPRLKIEAARALFSYAFPLNIRELEQALASALVLADGDVIALRHLPDAIRGARTSNSPRTSSSPPEPRSAEDEATYNELIAALRETQGNVSETARRMGKARQQIQRWIRRFAINPTRFRGESR